MADMTRAAKQKQGETWGELTKSVIYAGSICRDDRQYAPPFASSKGDCTVLVGKITANKAVSPAGAPLLIAAAEYREEGSLLGETENVARFEKVLSSYFCRSAP